MDELKMMRAIEAVLFASGDPIDAGRIALVLDTDVDTIQRLAKKLAEAYEQEERGIRIVRLNDSLQMHSAPEYAEVINRALEQRRPPKLSQSSLEVLAVVAYFQPVTRAYVEKMRGLDSSYTIGVLLDRGLIESCGQLDTVGRPTLYRTTDLFLRTMGIETLEELPELPPIKGSDAVLQLQKQVEMLQAAAEQENEMSTPNTAP